MSDKSILGVLLIVITCLILTLSSASAQAGIDLILPMPRRSIITQTFDEHPCNCAIDYRGLDNSLMNAAAAGTVIEARSNIPDGEYAEDSYGNYIKIDHGDGYTTLYAHLSQNDFAVSVGQYVSMGEQIARIDDTGDSTASHLHFELRHNGTPIDPYNSGDWVSDEPIPAGIRDENHVIRGPFALDDSKIRNLWVSLDGEPGAPIQDDWISDSTRLQRFERGLISYYGSYPAVYSPYPKVHLPDVRVRNGDWNSSIVARNNGGPSYVSIYLYDEDGDVVDSRAYHIPLSSNAVWDFDASSLDDGWPDPNPINDFSGVAEVTAQSDVAVLVENLKSGEATNYQGITPAGGLGNAGWGQAGTTVYIPGVKNALYGRTGQLYILNTSADTVTITPRFRKKDATSSDPVITCSAITIPPKGRSEYAPSDCGLATNELYGAQLDADQPLAVVLVEQNDSGSPLTASNNGFSAGAQTNYAPVFKNSFHPEYSPNSSALVVQNVGSFATDVDVTYYDRDSGTTWADSFTGLESLSAHIFPATGVGEGKIASAKIESSGQVLVSAGYEYKDQGEWRMQYNDFLAGSDTIILPRIYKKHPDGSATWSTGIQVQNVGTSPTTVTVSYYDMAGSLADTEPKWVQENNSVTFYQPSNGDLNDGFVGSAVITSDNGQPIVAQVNVTNDGPGDAAMSYSGFNR